MTHQRTLTAAHWGVYEVEYDDKGQAAKLHPFSNDPDPSPIGLHMLSDEVARLRVRRPAFRKSWLERGPGAASDKRGQEPFVELPWDEALDRVAAELKRVKDTHSNRAIFGGSYGWSSAGRFHHAQSQVHRFLNAIGGYVRHMDSYSLGAARVLMPHIVAGMEELMSMHTSWDVLAEHCKLFVTFGGAPHKNAQINAGGAMVHRLKDGLYGMRAKGVRFVNITPTAEDLDTGGDIEWLAIRPNTDAAMILALCNVLLTENLHDREFLDRCTVGFDKFAPSLADKTPGMGRGDLRHSRSPHPGPRARDGGDPHHGQHQLVAAAQPSRRAAVLGAGDARLHAGPDRPAGRRLRRELRPDQHHGQQQPAVLRPDAVAGHQRGARLHPGRALHRHAAQSGRQDPVQRAGDHLSRHPPGLLGGRQSVPSPPGPQPPARRVAQARDDRLQRAVLDAGREDGRHRAARDHRRSSATISATPGASPS